MPPVRRSLVIAARLVGLALALAVFAGATPARAHWHGGGRDGGWRDGGWRDGGWDGGWGGGWGGGWYGGGPSFGVGLSLFDPTPMYAPYPYYAYPPPAVYYPPPPASYYPPPPAAAYPPPAAPIAADPASAPFTASNGQTCREYQTTMTINGAPQHVHGTACRQADGSWRIVN